MTAELVCGSFNSNTCRFKHKGTVFGFACQVCRLIPPQRQRPAVSLLLLAIQARIQTCFMLHRPLYQHAHAESLSSCRPHFPLRRHRQRVSHILADTILSLLIPASTPSLADSSSMSSLTASFPTRNQSWGMRKRGSLLQT